MTWESGTRELKHFSSQAASFVAFKDLWARKYGGFPTLEQAALYTGSHNAKRWLENVTKIYYQ